MTYEDVDAYLATIERVRALCPTRLHTGHLPVLEGAAIGAFLDESAAFVAQLDAVLLERLAATATLRELCAAADAAFGPFPAGAAMFRFAVLGHVRRLVRRGAVELVVPLDLPRRYRAV